MSIIRIQRAEEVEEAFFEGRDFRESIDSVKTTLQEVRQRGDTALRELSQKFDGISPTSFEVPADFLKDAAQKMQKGNSKLYDALCYSRDMALKFALKQKESFTDFEAELTEGVFTGQKNIPVERAGVYVPAGRFALVSTVVMTVTPAKAAGVKEIILCTPPRLHPQNAPYADQNIMAAAYICGANRVFACGGAQAIAAMAFGTQSIPKVDVIVGPGNKFVAEAKRLVYGTVGIDMVAGPTEVLIIADSSANPEWVAADLLAQAEHDSVAQPVLVTDSESLARNVSLEIQKQLATLPTKEVAEQSIKNYGRIILVKDIKDACAIANRKAPEHLELALDEGEERSALVKELHNYGSLFIGHGSAEVFGDYAAGLNHTLPTSGTARFTGGLSVRMFLKTVTTLRTIEHSKGATDSAMASGVLGDAEGLSAHARAARLRLN